MDTLYQTPVAGLADDARAAFLTRTYTHLLGAILLFAGIEVFLFTSGLAYPIANAMLSVSWLLVLGGFVIAGTLASRAAATAQTKGTQYGALGAYIVVEALIFVPLLAIANEVAPGAIGKAAWVTVLAFSGLTAVAFFSGKDFSFLGGFIKWAGILAIVAIVVGVLTGFNLGLWFSVAMVGLAGASILWSTSRILREYPQDRYVSASLELFASVALMFWYVLSIFMSRD